MNKATTRNAYENAMNGVARLAAYALAKDASAIDEEVLDRCQRLAVDDMIHTSISLRRLVEATSLRPLTQNTIVPLARLKVDHATESIVREGAASLWDLLGLIVHARLLELIDNKVSLAAWAGRGMSRVLEVGRNSSVKWVSPVCFVKSDWKSACFYVADFAGRSSQVLSSARDVASKNGLHLDSFFTDL